jgi:hypothetical protein
LPSGPFKVVVDGGSVPSIVEVLQFNGPSATTLQVAEDDGLFAASVKGGAAPATRVKVARPHRVIKSRQVFKPLPR